MPQLQQQYKGMSDQLGFKLANQGLQKSSQAQGQYGSLSDTMKNAQTQIGQQGQQYANQMQSNVANQEGNLFNLAQSATNPGEMQSQTLGITFGFARAVDFCPDWTIL